MPKIKFFTEVHMHLMHLLRVCLHLKLTKYIHDNIFKTTRVNVSLAEFDQISRSKCKY